MFTLVDVIHVFVNYGRGINEPEVNGSNTVRRGLIAQLVGETRYECMDFVLASVRSLPRFQNFWIWINYTVLVRCNYITLSQ